LFLEFIVGKQAVLKINNISLITLNKQKVEQLFRVATPSGKQNKTKTHKVKVKTLKHDHTNKKQQCPFF
jgi:hypothetical protein